MKNSKNKTIQGAGTLFLALALTGCQVVKTTTGSAIISNNSAKFSGSVVGPASIISNNSSKIISNNSSKYRVAADEEFKEFPFGSALLYLSTLDGKHYADENGKNFISSSDTKGKYAFEKGPVGSVMINAVLENNQRLSGYVYAVGGKENVVDISLASTYNAEFFRWMMRSKSAAEVAQVKPETLSAITAETNALLKSKKLGIPDLTMGAAVSMCNAYAAAFNKSLSDLWTTVLKQRPISITTFAGNYMLGSGDSGKAANETQITYPAGIVQDKTTGDIFLAMVGEHKIRVVGSDGKLIDYAGKFEGDPSEYVPSPDLSGLITGISRTEASVPSPLDLDIDSDGNLIWTAYTGNDLQNAHFLWMLCRKSGNYYGINNMQAGLIYRLGGGTDGKDSFQNVTDGKVLDARFAFPWGICLDDANNIFVADRRNNCVRKIERTSGNVSTVIGDPTDAANKLDPVAPDKLGDGGDMKAALLSRPYDVIWRKNGTNGELYILDAFNNRIRKVVSPDSFATGTVTTLVGGMDKWGFQDGDLATAKVALTVGDGTAASLNVSQNGFGIDRVKNLLYVSDFSNNRVRVIDLVGNTIRTVAGGGTNERNGLALDAKLLDLSYIYVVPSGEYTGSVLVSDRYNNVVRRINSQWGL